jgi:hypothetical protein
MMTVSSSFESIVIRPSGGFVAAVKRPWYRRVFAPEIVDDAKLPRPFVSSHSRLEAASKFVQMSESKEIMR